MVILANNLVMRMEVIALIVLVNKRNSILENYQIDLCLSCS